MANGISPKTKVEFVLFRHGDTIQVPRVGLVRSPCRFYVSLAEKDTVLNILRGIGYRSSDFIYRIIYGQEISQPDASKRYLSKDDSASLDLKVNFKLGRR